MKRRDMRRWFREDDLREGEFRILGLWRARQQGARAAIRPRRAARCRVRPCFGAVAETGEANLPESHWVVRLRVRLPIWRRFT